MHRLLALSVALSACLVSTPAKAQYYYYDRHHHHHHNDEAAAFIIGGVIGAIGGYALGSSRYYGYGHGYYGRPYGYGYPAYGYAAPAYPYPPPPPVGYGYYGGGYGYGYSGGYVPYRRVYVAPYAGAYAYRRRYCC